MDWMNERYELKEKLGEGGFGAVYRALHSNDGTEVAIKVLHEPQVSDFHKRFEREVKILREYRHPGVMRVLDADLRANPPYYVMPLYRKGSLKGRSGKLSPEEFLTILEGLVEVLTHLEERGAFHRDIKPGNILLDEDNKPVLCDFGVGNDPAITDHFTRHQCGTPGYMAPELTRLRNGATPQCDVYSLGATAFELLTGIHPGDITDFHKYLKPFPPEIRGQILSMLDPEPSRRPTARALSQWFKDKRAKLGEWLEGAKNAVGSGSSVPRWFLPTIPVWVLALVGALIVGGVVYGAWRIYLWATSDDERA